MAEDNRKLTYEITANTDRFEASMKKASGAANDNFQKMEARGQESARKIDASFVKTAASVVGSMATMGAGAAALARNLDQIEKSSNLAGTALKGALHFVVAYRVAIGIFLAVSAAANKSAEAIERMGHIAEASESAGVNSTFLQGWTNQAEQLGLKVADIEKALVTARAALTDKSDELGKQMVNPVQRLLDELYRSGEVAGKAMGNFLSAGNLEQRIQAVKIAIREMLDAGKDLQAAKLGEMAFGGAGEQIVAGIKSGKIEVEAMGSIAKSTGAVFSSELIAKASELTDRLAVARAEMQTGMVPVMNDLAAIGLTIKSGWVAIEEAIGRSSTALGNFYALSKSAYAEVSKVNAEVYSDRRSQARIGIATGGKDAIISEDDLRREKAYAEIAAKLRTDRLDKRGDISGLPDGSAAFLSKGNLPTNAPAPPTRPPMSELLAQPRTPTPAAPSGAESADEVERYLNRLQRTVEVLNAETAAFGKSNVEKQRSVRLAEAEAAARARGTPLTDEERKKVDELAAASGRAADQMERLQKQRQGSIDAANFAGNQIVDSIDAIALQGQSASKVLENLIKLLIKAALQAMILGQGPLAGIMGTTGVGGAPGGLMGNFFSSGLTAGSGGLYADGGHVSGPGTGTSDSIPAMLSNGEFVVRADATRRHGALLHAINTGRLPGFASGGFVAPSMPKLPAMAAMSDGAQAISINAPITVSGSAGTHEQNTDLARQMGKQLESTMRGVVQSEIMKMRRPGNVLNQ